MITNNSGGHNINKCDANENVEQIATNPKSTLKQLNLQFVDKLVHTDINLT
jgi:hypothetical protein